MHTLTNAVLFLALAFAPFQGAPAKPAAPAVAQKPADKLKLEMQGLWQLLEMKSNGLLEESRSEVGYMLVGGDILSLEVHIAWKDNGPKIVANTFFSGTHRFTVDEDGKAKLSTMIGSLIGPNALLVYEPPGTAREYTIHIEENRLTMLRPQDQTRFVFKRIVAADTGLDFYGRAIKPKDDNGNKKQ